MVFGTTLSVGLSTSTLAINLCVLITLQAQHCCPQFFDLFYYKDFLLHPISETYSQGDVLDFICHQNCSTSEHLNANSSFFEYYLLFDKLTP